MGLIRLPVTCIVPDRAFIAVLFCLGLGLRWLFADGDLVGDDAWYLYLSRSFGTESAAQGEHPWFHIANRPLYYAIYHVSTYGGLIGFRLLGCVIGAALPVLSFQAARRAGATFASAAIASAVLCLQAQHLKYSALGFPDVLASGFALGACWALAAESLGLALTLSAACVVAKESFVAAPVLIAFFHLSAGRSRFRIRHWIALAFPLLYVAAISLLPIVDKSLRMQGWSDTPLTLNFARNMWVGPEVWPLIAWLAWRRQGQLLTLWLALPAFYVVWTVLLGRGIAPWYVLGPAALASVAVAHALDFVNLECTRRSLSFGKRLSVVGLCLCCFAPLPLYGLSRTRAQLSHLDGKLPAPSAAPQVVALIERAQPQHLLLINCFWAFGYSHLRAGKPADSTWWHRQEDADDVLRRAEAASLVVVCHDPQHEFAEQQLRRLPRELLLDDGAYLVFGDPKR